MDFNSKEYYQAALAAASKRMRRKAEALQNRSFSKWDCERLQIGSLGEEVADDLVKKLKTVKKPVI